MSGFLLRPPSVFTWRDPMRTAAFGGGSRHALTVGFLVTMVVAIGQSVLPAFSGMRLLFSKKLMFPSLSV
jgi:hypothetical protein